MRRRCPALHRRLFWGAGLVYLATDSELAARRDQGSYVLKPQREGDNLYGQGLADRLAT